MDSNNQHVNTWSGGMNTDSSDALIQSTLYRYAENLRYITETEENTGELHLIPGAKYLSDIFAGIDSGNSVIIGTAELRDLGIFIVDTYVEGGLGWTVCTVKNESDLSNIQTKIKPVFSTTDTSRVVNANKLSLVTKYEDDDNLKLYIADGLGPIIIISLIQDECLITDDVSAVSAYPSVEFLPPSFDGFADGMMEPSVVQYSYQFYNKYGQQSEISPVTKLIPIVDGKNGYLSTDVTNKGVLLSIQVSKNITFERIKVFRIQYKQNGQLPTIHVIYDEKLTSETESQEDTSQDDQLQTDEWPFGPHRVNPIKDKTEDITILVKDNGYTSFGTLSIEEYNSITGIHIIPRTIESKDEYLFAGNILDKSDEFDILVKDLDFTSPTDNTGHSGLGTIISWQFIIPQNPIQIDANIHDDRIDDVVDGSSTFTDPAVSSQYRSLRRDEIYRYGIVLYNSIGEASSVKWIEDIHTPTASDSNTFVYQNNKLYARPLGIGFTVNTSALPSEVKAYEIVRCKRGFEDVFTISQGVVTKPIKMYESANDPILAEGPWTPTGIITNSRYFGSGEYGDELITNTARSDANDQQPYLFISPEVSYNDDSIITVKQDKTLKLVPVEYIYPINAQKICDVGETAELYNIGNKYSNFTVDYDISGGYGNNVAPILMMYPHINTWDLYKTKDELVASYGNDTRSWSVGFSDVLDENQYLAQRRYSYIKMYNVDSVPQLTESIDINGVQISNVLSYNDYADTARRFLFKDKLQAVGQYTYLNWVINGGYYMDYDDHGYADIYIVGEEGIYRTLLGPAGKCAILDVDNVWPNKFSSGEQNKAKVFGTYICNLRKNAVPYGGDSTAAKKLSTYKSFGDYFIVGEQRSSVYHEIYNGDCYILPFEYTSLHKWVHPDLQHPINACITYSIPIETNINLFATSGFELSKNINAAGDISYIQELPANVNTKLIQTKPLYVYNTVYSINDSPRLFSADDDEYDLTNLDYRVYNSLYKTNNEEVDSWLKFLPANYIDVDSRLGQITGLRRFKNQLVFWQDDAAGILSVNERSLITDHDKMPLILGSGDVLSRYDYITTSNGMKVDQYADAQSESTLYWWDYIRKEICAYQQGQGYNVLSKSKFVLNYINKGVNTENPKLIFDKQYNELISNVVNDESIIYNELTGNFMSIYKIHPLFCVTFPDKLLLANENECDVYQWNRSTDGIALGMDTTVNGLYPKLQYIINKGADTTKVFDNGEIAGRFYGGNHEEDKTGIEQLEMQFWTPLKQHSSMTGEHITNREYNFRYAIPRHNNAEVGERMRGKTMKGELSSTSNSLDFSIQYIMTKFRVSWA